MLRMWLLILLGMLTAAMLAGCGETPQPAAEEPVPADSATNGSVDLTQAEIQSLAEQQKVCAVSGEPLGSMGTPLPVGVTDAKGDERTVLLCCESCRQPLLDDPDQYLAKLDAPAGGPAQN